MSRNSAIEVIPLESNLTLGDVISVKAGRMRNTLYPYSMAQYIRPGSDTFLTQNKLAIALGPNVNPEQDHLDSLLNQARERIANQQKLAEEEAGSKPPKTGRADVLMQIEEFKLQLRHEGKWKRAERAELEKFLDVQMCGWGLLKDELGSKKVRERKEQILLETWRKFTAGMTLPPQEEVQSKVAVKEGLEQEPSTSGSVVQGDVKVVSEAVERPVGVGAEGIKTPVKAQSTQKGKVSAEVIETPVEAEVKQEQKVSAEGAEETAHAESTEKPVDAESAEKPEAVSAKDTKAQ